METIIISLGGSLIVPDEIDTNFLGSFKKIIINNLKRRRYVVICGGGKTCRNYQRVASEIAKIASEELDWIGIAATRLNAHLIRAIFGKWAHKEMIKNPTEKINFKKIAVAAGWKPGHSTDYDSVLIAKNLKIKTIINLTNIDYVYDKDPRKFKDAKPLKKISWENYQKLVGKKWKPGLSTPFDPIASILARKLKLKVIVMNGRKLKSLENFLKRKPFIGTTIN